MTPTITESTVATRPTKNASSRVSRIPTSSWDSTSWPLCVVPSRCAPYGACSDSAGDGFWNEGSYGATIGPMMPASTNRPSRIAPGLGLGRHPAPAAGPGFFLGQRGGFGADRQDGGHDVASLLRARGSATTMIMSTIRLASSTANVITRKIACISG